MRVRHCSGGEAEVQRRRRLKGPLDLPQQPGQRRLIRLCVAERRERFEHSRDERAQLVRKAVTLEAPAALIGAQFVRIAAERRCVAVGVDGLEDVPAIRVIPLI